MKVNDYRPTKNPATYDLKALREQLQNLALQVAMTELMEEEAAKAQQEIDEAVARDGSWAYDAHIAENKKKALALIRQNVRREKRRHFVRTTLPKLAHVMPTVLLILIVSAGVAVATVQPIRAHVTELLVNMEAQYAELSLVENKALSFDVPGEWEGSYFLAGMPEGFNVVDAYNGFDTYMIRFLKQGTSDQWITFNECYEDIFGNIDTEDGVVSAELIKGYAAVVVQKERKTIIAWKDDVAYFFVESKGMTVEETLVIARSIRRIKK